MFFSIYVSPARSERAIIADNEDCMPFGPRVNDVDVRKVRAMMARAVADFENGRRGIRCAFDSLAKADPDQAPISAAWHRSITPAAATAAASSNRIER